MCRQQVTKEKVKYLQRQASTSCHRITVTSACMRWGSREICSSIALTQYGYESKERQKEFNSTARTVVFPKTKHKQPRALNCKPTKEPPVDLWNRQMERQTSIFITKTERKLQPYPSCKNRVHGTKSMKGAILHVQRNDSSASAWNGSR